MLLSVINDRRGQMEKSRVQMFKRAFLIYFDLRQCLTSFVLNWSAFAKPKASSEDQVVIIA